MTIPKNEYPRPQLVRSEWMNLNGTWQFEFDQGKTGEVRGLIEKETLDQTITVPYCPESELSGIHYTDFINAVWYKKEFELPAGWSDKRTLLHFEAVDYLSKVWVNGMFVGHNYGCGAGFTLDITAYVAPGKNTITLYAEDDTRSDYQPSGKQSVLYYSHGCSYTRTTGIWQTVWLEAVPLNYVKQVKYFPNIDEPSLDIDLYFNTDVENLPVSVQAAFEGKAVGSATITANSRYARLHLPLSEKHLWGPGEGNLYDLTFTVGDDAFTSYAGLRKITYKNGKTYINDKPVFMRLVLDQGFYPDGIWTAPTDEALKRDIEISMDFGFNGARLHQKVFEQRFHYYADKMGYLTWGEYNDWGLHMGHKSSSFLILEDFQREMDRDFNHPSIIGWCPSNETAAQQWDRGLGILYRTVKAIDPTRPVIDASGWHHVETDIMDVHDYEQNPEAFARKFDSVDGVSVPFYNHFRGPIDTDMLSREDYAFKKDESGKPLFARKPYFVSEYGGIWWKPEDLENGWGYGARPQSEQEFLERYRGLTLALLNHPYITGFCYTQLTDVEQEVNGLCKYNRTYKFDPAFIREVNQTKAAIEKE